MFICDYCKKTAPAGMSENKVVLKTRAKVYPERRNDQDEIIDKGGVGEEIVEEVKLCTPCIEKLQKEISS